MYKKSNVDPMQIFKYVLLSFASNWVGFFIAFYVGMAIKKTDIISTKTHAILLMMLEMLPVSLLVCWIATWFYFKNIVPRHYKIDEDKNFWLKNLLLLVAPGEILRFIICLFSLGDMTQTGVFGIPASILFEGTYQVWTGRTALITKNQFIFSDYIAYLVCYAVYFAIHFTVLYFMYKHYWVVGKRERDDLVVHK